jgi:hypothetical protein
MWLGTNGVRRVWWGKRVLGTQIWLLCGLHVIGLVRFDSGSRTPARRTFVNILGILDDISDTPYACEPCPATFPVQQHLLTRYDNLVHGNHQE